jgi:transposase
MARPRRIDHHLVIQARTAAAAATDITQLRTAQAVLLPAVLQTSLEQTASVLGVGRATVARLQARFRQQVAGGALRRSRWGGRRRALLRPEEEQAFLATWRARAEAGELVVLSPLRAALSQQVGRPVAPSGVFGRAARHRWGTGAPDPGNPKRDGGALAVWKKKRFRRSWRPC